MRIDPKDATPAMINALGKWIADNDQSNNSLVDAMDFIFIRMRMGVPVTLEADYRKDSRTKGVDNGSD